jgi:hypothetical protein
VRQLKTGRNRANSRQRRCFTRSDSQNSRGLAIRTPTARFRSSRIVRSPVINTSVRPAIAAPTIARSLRSSGKSGSLPVTRTISYPRRNPSTASMVAAGTRNLRLNTERNSAITTLLVISSCSVITRASTCEHRPRVPKALARTFVSGKTLTRRRRKHPRQSGIPALPRTALLAVSAIRSAIVRGVSSKPHAQLRSASGPSVCTLHRAKVSTRHRA